MAGQLRQIVLGRRGAGSGAGVADHYDINLVVERRSRARQSCPRLDGYAPPKQGNDEPAARRPQCRGREVLKRWVPAGRKVLKVFQNGGVHSKAADHLHAASANEMLKSAREPSPHHLLRR
jgi:hypothetical protein